jgi:simple sugar transport system substrate-binding protein
MKIIKSQSADFTRAKGKEVMEAFLKAERGRIQAVYAHNDDMALGAIQAIEEAGLKPGKDILIVSIDAVRGAFEAMIAGKLNATVECNPLFGPILFDTIDKLRAGEKLPKFIKNTDRLFTQETAAEDIKTREY